MIFVSSGVVKQSSGPSGEPTPSPSPDWSRCAACCPQELEGEPNIRVNSVNPGRMRTAMRAAAYPAEDPNTVPDAGLGERPFLYLLSARSRGIDGQYIEAQ